MKKYLFLLFFLWFFIPTPSLAVYSYYRSVTVTSTITVASGTQLNFPMLVSSTLVSWESTTSNASGRIQNLCKNWNGFEEPCDLVFTTSTPTASGNGWTCPKADFETERYVSSTGELVDWVKFSSLSASSVVYACYGDTAVNTSQSASSTVWNKNFRAVYHLAPQSNFAATTTDSTSFRRDAVNANVTTSTAGKIDGAGSFNGSTSQLTPGTMLSTSTFTISAWTNLASSLSYQRIYGATSNSFYETNLSGVRLDYFGVGNDNTGNTTLNTGTWYNVAAVGNTLGMTFYVNGVFDGSSTNVQTIGTTVNIGGDFFFNGTMDEVRLADAARSADWLLDEYNNQNSPGTFYVMGSETAGGGTSPPGGHRVILSRSRTKLNRGRIQIK